jgi:hypothetical protein
LIKKVTIYFIAFVSILYVYRLILYTGMRKNNQGVFNKYNELFLKKDNTYDVLFLGSSRAEMHFNPKNFDEITGLNSYNMGISGASLKVSYVLLKSYLNDHAKPKYLIVNVDYFSLKNDTDRLNDFPRYFPYLQNEFLRNELNKIDGRFNSFYLNPLHSLPYSQLKYLSASIHGWLNISGKYDSLMYKGFQTNLSNEEVFGENLEPINSYISIKNRNYLDSFIVLSKSRNINLILVTSPVFGSGKHDVLNKGSLVNQLSNIAYINKCLYFNYTDSAMSENKSYFFDHFHLNRYGAAKFTSSFSQAFHNNLTQKPLFNK